LAEQEKRRRQGDWSAVRDAVTVRMKQLGISRAELHRRSGLADNTLRRIIEEEGAAESTLVLTAAILGWPYPFDGLKKILGGEPQKNERPPEEKQESDESVAEKRFREVLQTDLHQVKEDIAELRGDVNSMNSKLASIVQIIQGWDHGSGPPT
jgi:lambda repressor-like predicted transcriptional regulator